MHKEQLWERRRMSWWWSVVGPRGALVSERFFFSFCFSKLLMNPKRAITRKNVSHFIQQTQLNKCTVGILFCISYVSILSTGK